MKVRSSCGNSRNLSAISRVLTSSCCRKVNNDLSIKESIFSVKMNHKPYPTKSKCAIKSKAFKVPQKVTAFNIQYNEASDPHLLRHYINADKISHLYKAGKVKTA